MRALLPLAASALLAPGLGLAEDAATLPAVEVSAQLPALEREPPALTTEVTAEQIEAMNAPDVEDTLKYEPNLVVRKRFIGDRNAPVAFRDTHQLQTPRALVLGDGLQLSNFLGAGWDFAPRWGVMQPEEIDYVEVLYGPYSAEYGGNSLGGVVILHGRMPEQFEAQASVSGFVQDFDAYGSSGTHPGYKLYGSVGDKRGRWTYFLAADRLENESQPMQFGVTSPRDAVAGGTPVTGAFPYAGNQLLYNSTGPTEITQDLLKLKLGYDLSDDLQARLTVAYLSRNEDTLEPETFLRDAAGNPVHDGDIAIIGRPGGFNVRSQRLSEAEGEDLIIGGELEGSLGGGWEIKSALSFYNVLRDKTHSSAANFEQARIGGPGTLTKDQGSGWEVLDVKLGHRHDGGWLGERVLFGYHFSRYTLDKTIFNTADWRRGSVDSLSGDSEGRTRVRAVFLENEWRLGEPWTLTLGGRQEWWQAYDGSLAQDVEGSRFQAAFPKRSESRFSPKASLAFEPNRDWHVSLSLGLAYRFPTVGELYQGSLDNQGRFVTDSFDPDLATERGFAKNLMLKRFFGGGAVTVNLWENDVDNAIFRQTNVDNVTSYQNVDRVRSRGIELIGQWQNLLIDGLDLDANLAYTRAKILENAGVPDSVGKQFPRVPEWRANLFASYRASERLRLGAGMRYASDPYDQLNNSDGRLSGFGFTDQYLVFDARASYRFGEQLMLAVGIDNLTDERYFVFHPYPGRTLFTELKWAH